MIDGRRLMSFGYWLLFAGLTAMAGAILWPQAQGETQTVALALLNIKTVLAACGGGLVAGGGALVGAGAIVLALKEHS